MNMHPTKKIMRGTKQGFDREIEMLKAKGWEVVYTLTLPRGNTNKFTYFADLKRKTK